MIGMLAAALLAVMAMVVGVVLLESLEALHYTTVAR